MTEKSANPGQSPMSSESASPLDAANQVPGTGGISHRRWFVIGLVFAATTINYLDRQTLSIVAPTLQRQFAMSSTAYGSVVAAFMLAYTIMNGVMGRVIDRLGSKIGYLLTIVWWSGAEVLHVFARGPVGLGICRFLLGAGEAGNWPAGVKVVSEWFPERERALAAGIFHSGSAFGALLAPPAVAFLTLRCGWRWAFGLMGCLGFIWAAIWIASYRRPPSDAPLEQTNPMPLPLRQLVRSRLIWQFTIAKIFVDPVWYFYTFWFPQYLKASGGFSLKAIGETAWIPFLAADLGNIVGGYLGGKVLKRFPSLDVARKVTIIFFLALMGAGTLAASGSSAMVGLALASVATFGYTAALANMLALPADRFPSHAVASFWGFASMGAGLGGMLFSLVTGVLVDRFSFSPVFVLFGGIPIIACWLIWTLPDEHYS